MYRFVDVRNQGLGGRFAWFDTTTDKFLAFDGEQVFADWEEFTDYADNEQITRCRRLAPEWVHEPAQDSEMYFGYDEEC